MAAPRLVLPNTTYLITRRCSQRTFRLRPSACTNGIFLYCLALAAAKSGVLIHAVCVMSDHHHLVVTDIHGTLPNFLRELHRSTAKAINAAQGQWESLWTAEPTSAISLADAEDVLRKIAYVAANPVDAGLVATPEEWPGVNLWGHRTRTLCRPEAYFDPKGDAPDAVELLVTPPKVACDDVDWGRRLVAEICGRVAAARDAMRAKKRRFLGQESVLTASFASRAKSHERKRGVVPKIAAVNRAMRVAALATYRAFRSAYRAALGAWRAGDRGTVFPPGTWWMRVHHAACVAPLAIAA